MSLAMGLGGFVNVAPGPVRGNGVPPDSFRGQLGQQYFDVSVSPPTEYVYNGVTWVSGGNAYATTSSAGIVQLSDDVAADSTSETLVPTAKATYDYGQSLVIAGANDATTVTKGIVYLAEDDDVVTPYVADFPNTSIQPSNITPMFAAPPPIGSTTPAAATFTDFTVTGTVSISSAAPITIDVTGAGNDLTLSSDAGRVVVNGEEAADDAVRILSAAGGLDVNVALQMNLATSETDADSFVISSGGGLDITATGAAGKDIDIVSTSGSINLTAGESIASSMVLTNNGMQVVTSGAAARDITLTNTGGSIGLSASEAVSDAINIDATAGGIDVDAVGQINIRSTQNAVDSIVIESTLGGIDILSSGATAEDIDIINTGGSVNIESTENAALAVYLHANGGTSETIRLRADQGTGAASIDILSDVGGITLTAGVASADAINLVTSNAGGGIDIDSGTAGFIVDTTGAISLDAAAASNFTVTGAFALDIVSTLGKLSLQSGQSANDSIEIKSLIGGIDILAAGAAAGEDIDIIATGSSVNISATENDAGAITILTNGGTSERITVTSSQGTNAASIGLVSTAGGITLTAGLATADAININASNAGGGIDIDSGTAGFIVDTTGAFSIDGAAASNITTTGAGIDLTLSSSLGSVLIESTEDAALAIRLHANGGTSETIQLHSDLGTGVGSINLLSDVGGITLRATGLASADAINLEAPAGGLDVDVALQMNLASSQAAASAIVITASDAAGGIDITTGGGSVDISSAGFATVVAATDTEASPSATAVINANVGRATFTGFTTAAAASQVFVITNSIVTTSSCVLVTVANEGANDAQMTMTRVTRAAGSLSVTCQNMGAAALNGNVVVNFWVLTA